MRISGPDAGDVIERLAGAKPPPRQASLRTLRDPSSGETIDHGMVLWFPAPRSVTGEDLAEVHLHGGRAVVSAMLKLLSSQPGCREARPGEFSRRGFENGKLDLVQAEGLADLIGAETEMQRRAALSLAEGALSALVHRWRDDLLVASALVEAQLDFSDETDVVDDTGYKTRIGALLETIGDWLAQPPAERLKEGVRVVVAGPPNSGKSSLVNALTQREMALVSDIAGTTRDRIEAPVSIEGLAMVLVDTAGLRDGGDLVEQLGIELSRREIERSDIVLWLGEPGEMPAGAVLLGAKADLGETEGLAVSAHTGVGVARLRRELARLAGQKLPQLGGLALNQRHREALYETRNHLEYAMSHHDLLLVAERLREASAAIGNITGGTNVENMLDRLFGRLCIGK